MQTAERSAISDSDADGRASLQFRIFAMLWAVATLFHMAHSSLFNTQFNFALLTLTALYVIARPGVPAFILLIVLQVFDALYRMPFASNHWVFTAFVNLTILHAYIYQMVVNRSLMIPGGKILDSFAPLVRIEVIVLYFFAVFHKLNAGFFAPDTSCAFDLVKAQHLDDFIPLAAQFYKWNPYFTILAELAIPVLLCINRTRYFAIFFGLFFHGVLAFSSYNAFYDFSSMIVAAYFLFTNPKLSESIVRVAGELRIRTENYFQSYSALKIGMVVMCLAVGAGFLFVLNQRIDSARTVHLMLWGIYCFIILVSFLLFWLTGMTEGTRISFSSLHWSLLLLPVIVFANGMSPYLGLKTENSYAMFSNLRTEGGLTNHFIVPPGLQMFNFQKDVVEILSSTDKGLQDLADRKKAIVLFELKNHIQNRKPQRVDYLLNGEQKVYERSDLSTHAAVQPNPFLLTRLMRFRTFSKTEPQPCSH